MTLPTRRIGCRSLTSFPASLALVALVATSVSCASAPTVAPVPPTAVAADPSGGSASSSPPAGLRPEAVPLFVLLGFDDNFISGMPGSDTTGSIRFVVDLLDGKRNPPGRGNPRTFDGAPARIAFYSATRYLEAPDADRPENVKRALRAAADAGHEIGLHTHSHSHGAGFTSAQWAAEIATCSDWLSKPFDGERAAEPAVGLGVARTAQLGFRAPFLELGPPLFPALRERGLAYDCSVEVGTERSYDGGNFPWPYRVAAGYGGEGRDPARELWELPVYAMIVPPDELCERYGVPPGLREKLHRKQDYFDVADGKITGFDWNLWVAFQMSAPEVLATFRYTLDRRLAGNRAPLTFGTHSDIYSEQYDGITGSTAEERRRALATIVEESLAHPEVRLVTGAELVGWLRSPAAL